MGIYISEPDSKVKIKVEKLNMKSRPEEIQFIIELIKLT
jgi:hypothetical protein